ncbi:AraC family transcriptional regulator [Clostridium tagluense]|uniref:helix-turn-helix domain-containing protein n=1 Tax=Clostridium tagluense TaxID=360422 RepID=UPI001C0DEAA5|nr:AraC family transcriptional regulator [Clostridium tagluense]MBU3128863.1 AraC family transcriptional regulator [Clostridium tagluense]MCB2310364.1 AraC family transcriptional regulator [Clostridium tagluense]MCB2314994.1 AraC family transcriptional regulator [Clostridium tagluense]MCB2320065.1 AraC family transcriptional regulator [Clostridium tagluense]MCB2324737.1 AraC family transcriptional regulator [Clostridium tagluense]
MRRFDEDMNMFRYIIGSKEITQDRVVYNISVEFGEGNIISYSAMPGIEVTYNDFEIYKPLSESFNLSIDSLEINYCLEGYLESEFANKKIVYMGDGDISIFGYKTGVVLADFTTKHYKGVTVMVYIDEASKSIGDMLGVSDAEIKSFIMASFNGDTCIVNHASQSLEHIFKEFFVLPEKFKNYFLRIKVVELLLYILGNSDYKTSNKKYFPRTFVDKIKDARRIILSDIDSHITIKELSHRVGINSTDLQKGFKAIYQCPIYAYLKSYRMKKAKELLMREELTIAHIANLVGYTNNSKFSKAFKEEFGLSPSKYRISSR